MKLYAHKLPLSDRLAALLGLRVREPKQVGRAFQPAGAGDFPVASSSEHRTGTPTFVASEESGEPAGWKACPTRPRNRHSAFLELP